MTSAPASAPRNLTLDDWATRVDAETPFEPGDLLEMAWCLIANADVRTIDERTDDWGRCARRWRAGYFATVDAERAGRPLGEMRVPVTLPTYVRTDQGVEFQIGSVTIDVPVVVVAAGGGQ